jgi:hypothetical protein
MSQSALALASVAMLRVDLNANRDYLEYLVPFIASVLNREQKTAVSDGDVQSRLKEDYGIDIPRPVVQFVLKRLSGRGWLKRTSGVYTVAKDMPEFNLAADRSAANVQIEELIAEFVKYASDTHQIIITIDEAADALINLFKRFGVEFITAYSQSTALPEISTKNNSLEYLTCAFIKYLNEQQARLYSNVVVALKGVLLSNALTCPDLDSIQKQFKIVNFILDTPVVLNLLGVQGEPAQTLETELIDLLQRLNGRIAIFDHTIEETMNVLQAGIDKWDRPGFAMRIIDEMKKQGKSKADLIMLRSDFEDILAKLGIARISAPRDLASYEIISEATLQKAIEDEIKYMNPKALTYDINSIRSIYALRSRGRRPFRLEDATAVLVTSNAALARAVSEYGHVEEGTSEVSAAITDYSLCNIAWLKAPMGAPSLPERELLALCYSAMEPGDALWSHYVREINKLKDNGRVAVDDHAILRTSSLAQKELMNLTKGNEAAFNVQTIDDVLERVKSELVSEEATKLHTEEYAHRETRRERDELKDERESIKKNLFWTAQRDSLFIARAVLIGSSLILGCALFAYAPINVLIDKKYGLISRILQGIGAVGLSFGLVNWITGLSVNELCGRLQRWLQGWLYRKRYKAIFKVLPKADSDE